MLQSIESTQLFFEAYSADLLSLNTSMSESNSIIYFLHPTVLVYSFLELLNGVDMHGSCCPFLLKKLVLAVLISRVSRGVCCCFSTERSTRTMLHWCDRRLPRILRLRQRVVNSRYRQWLLAFFGDTQYSVECLLLLTGCYFMVWTMSRCTSLIRLSDTYELCELVAAAVNGCCASDRQ